MNSFNLVLRNDELVGVDHGSGTLVTYEEARIVEVDRDIKAANLQLLVEKVLETEAEWCGETARWGEVKPLFDLARSLKQ